jgi:serine/threonine-protein kinase
MEPEAQHKIGIFLIQCLLGKGGMGSVYLATDPTLKRPVAVKVLAPELAADPEYVARFEREATSLARIRHPNLVHIYAVGRDASRYYIAMEYLKGISVAELLRQRGPFSLPQALRVLGQVLSALDKVHSAGIIHRDLKPANIMLDEDQRAILMDFGLAKPCHDRSVTSGATLIGTPEYMAPELAEGREADFRSDLYAVGIILFEMATGRVPFQGTSAIATLRQHLEKPIPSPRELVPSLPPMLDTVLAKALAKRPDDRYQDIRSLAADLVAVTHTPELAALAAPPERRDTTPTIPMDATATATALRPAGGAEPTTPRTVAAGATRWRLVAGRPLPAMGARLPAMGALAAALLIVLAIVLIPRLSPRGSRASRGRAEPATAIPEPSQTVYIVYSRVPGTPGATTTTTGRLLAIEGEEGNVVIKTATGTVEIPYADVLRIESVPGR